MCYLRRVRQDRFPHEKSSFLLRNCAPVSRKKQFIALCGPPPYSLAISLAHARHSGMFNTLQLTTLGRTASGHGINIVVEEIGDGRLPRLGDRTPHLHLNVPNRKAAKQLWVARQQLDF